MKNNFYKLMAIGLLFCASNSFVSAQTNPCATTEFTQKLRAQHPGLDRDFDNYNQQLKSIATRSTVDTTLYIVPIVFHIMHVNGAENISDAQIFAQMNRLNLDYRKRMADTTAIIKPFDTLNADIHIEFRLAQIDPNGNCTNGIDRIYTHKTFQADDASKVNQWPREKYLNVWVVHDIAGSTSTATILGFAHFPSDVAGPLFIYDGVIAVYSTINGSSRTLTHEIGHFLNLQHPWGSTNDPGVSCGDDQVDDTPVTKGHFSTCPLLDAACTLNPFTENFKFDSVTTTSGNIDPTPVATPIAGAAITSFKAVGVDANSSANGKFEFGGWDTGAPDGATAYSSLTGSINTSKYYEVKFDPQLQYNMKYTSINLRFNRSATGVRTFAIRSSRDGFVTNLTVASVAAADSLNMSVQTGNVFFAKRDSTNTITSAKITITSPLYSNDTMPVTFRIYGWNAEDVAGTFGIDSVNFVGSSDLIENVQNIMDYSSCTNMFTKHQRDRMRAAIESSTSYRNNLWSAANLAATGVLTGSNCVPYPDFYSNRNRVCRGDVVKFTKNIQHGTETAYTWTFEGGTPATATTSPINVTYNTPGLYKVTLTASNAAGADSVIKTSYIRVDEDWADIAYHGAYTEDFQSFTNPGDFYWSWQVNNYDNNANTWVMNSSTGYQSSKCVMMNAYGDYQFDVDDLVSPSYDLSYTSGNTMTFRCAAASTGGSAADVNDKLNVYISTNCGQTWTQRATFHDSTLINNGYKSFAFTPDASTVWDVKTVTIPVAFATSNVRFKFEYTSGIASNNVYLDNINIAGVVGINENISSAYSLSIYPNPTSENSTIAYHLDKKADTKITVTDVLGKTVYVQSNAGQPEGDYNVAISKQNQNLRNGIYFVRLSVGNESITKKLIITE